MQFCDLGPLALEVEELPRPIAAPRLEAVLGLLLIRRGHFVDSDALVDAVWAGAPPPRAGNALDSLIWRLRRLVEPGRTSRRAAVLLTRDHGYSLAVPEDRVDSGAFVLDASRLLAAPPPADPGAVVEAADAALLRWRGLPYEGLPEADWLQPTRTRLLELLADVQQHRIEGLLAAGRSEEAVRDVVGLLADHPYRERLWGLRMLGLYRLDRQQAALAAYQEAHRLLDRELGITPGAELRRLQQRILAQDPGLDLQGQPVPVAPTHLPIVRSPLLGRDAEVRELEARLDGNRLVTVLGPAGCGKTRLAVAVAWARRHRYPAGVWFVDLSGLDRPERVPAALVAAVGLQSPPTADPLDAILAFAREQPLLLVVDNCEHLVAAAADAIDRLLDGSELVVLATSREPLLLEDESRFVLEPLALPSSADPAELGANPAVQLFLRRRGPAADVDLAGPDGALVARICATTDGLPLGLELAGARARTYQLAEVAETLSTDPAGATEPGRGLDRHRTLRSAVEWSHRLVGEDEQLVHRRLACLPPSFTLAAATATCGFDPLRPERVVDLLGGLVHHSLLQVRPPERRSGPSTFTQLVPIRAHAVEALDGAGEAGRVRCARNDWMTQQIEVGPGYGEPGQAAWYEWLDDQLPTLEVVLDDLLGNPTDTALLLVGRLTGYCYERWHGIEAARWSCRAAAVATSDEVEPVARAAAFLAYGGPLALAQEVEPARPYLEDVLRICSTAEPSADTRSFLLMAALAAWIGDDFALGERMTRALLELGRSTSDPSLLGCGVALDAFGHHVRGAGERAAELAREALDRYGADLLSASIAYVALGALALKQRDAAAGLRWSTKYLETQVQLGSRNVADALEQRGGHYLNADRPTDAVRCFGAAAAAHRRAGRSWPRHPGTSARLVTLRRTLGEAAFHRAWQSGEQVEVDALALEWL